MYHIYKKIRMARIGDFAGIKRYYVFGKLLFQKYRTAEKKKKIIWGCKAITQSSPGQRIFYLKVQRQHESAFTCIQHWVDIAHELGAYIYFVCDKLDFELDILRRISFHDLGFQFIPSDRTTLKREVKNLLKYSERKWWKAAFAHLTTFTHAIEHNYPNVYNIDADDIEILLPAHTIAQAFRIMEAEAEKSDMHCFGLDMYSSPDFGLGFTLGVTYIRNPFKCIDILRKNQDWLDDIRRLSELHCSRFLTGRVSGGGGAKVITIDSFFSFMRTAKQLNIESWYIDNSYFVHMPDCLMDSFDVRLVKYSGGRVTYPCLKFFYNEDRLADKAISPTSYKIDLQLKESAMHDYMRGEGRRGWIIWRDLELKDALDQGLISQEMFDYYRSGQEDEKV